MQNEIIKNLFSHAYAMYQKAICPYSQFQVGASVMSDDKTISGGHNIESSSYGLTICAERVAIFNQLTQTRASITHLLLITATGSYPCGACRQIIIDFCPKATITIATPTKIINSVSAQELVPYAFNQDDLKK